MCIAERRNRLKRYLVFAGAAYYPSGGWKDYRAECDSLDEAKAYCDGYMSGDRHYWAHVVETDTHEIVYHV